MHYLATTFSTVIYTVNFDQICLIAEMWIVSI